MAYVGNEENVMKPYKGMETVSIPVTFGYKGGRNESFRKRVLWSVVVGLISLIIAVGFLIRNNSPLLTRIVLSVGVMIIGMLIIRFVLLHESALRKQYKELDDIDYKKDFRDMWGIYSIDSAYPYFVRFRNGNTGVFVRLNKDVILGKYEESEYEHYEAISDAYNIAGASYIGMCHLDYMDNVGSDERLQKCFDDLVNVKNPDLKDVLMGMYGYLQEQMDEKVTTFDVYVFTFRGNEHNAWNTIQRVLSCFLDANYVNYHVLGPFEVKNLFKSLFNVHEFSANEAMSDALSLNGGSVGIKPLKIIHADGTEEILYQEEVKPEEKVKGKKPRKKKKPEVEDKKVEDSIDLWGEEGNKK